MAVIQFPVTDNSRQRLHNAKLLGQQSQKNQKVVYTPVYVHGLLDICEQIKDLNDTMKYVTDGLYAIALEVKEVQDQIAKTFWSRLRNFFIGKSEKTD